MSRCVAFCRCLCHCNFRCSLQFVRHFKYDTAYLIRRDFQCFHFLTYAPRFVCLFTAVLAAATISSPLYACRCLFHCSFSTRTNYPCSMCFFISNFRSNFHLIYNHCSAYHCNNRKSGWLWRPQVSIVFWGCTCF